MGSTKMPEEYFKTVAHHLPTEQSVRPNGGGPASVTGSSTGSSGSSSPPAPSETTYRRNSLLRLDGGSPAPGLRGSRHLGSPARRPAGLAQASGQARFRHSDRRGATVPAFCGSEATGPSPVDRRKKGMKHTLLVVRHGVPLVIRTAKANASDHRQILPTVLDFPRVGGTPGKLKMLPADLYNNRGSDSEATTALMRWLGIEPHIAKRWTGPWQRAGQGPLGVERTISWLKGLRRIRVQYDRLG
jgi:hypothetical protein